MYASIIPAAWSFMLALRSRGLGSAWTTLHLFKEKEAAALLGIPDDVTQVALIPVGHTTGGDFKPARRPPVENITYWDTWGSTSAAER
jgi:nitroreductase